MHKAQGLTLPEVAFISFSLLRQWQFNYGQVYVALSRVRALSDLFIVGDIDQASVRADKRIEKEYERLRALQNFDDSSADIIRKSNSHNIVVTLLDIRSLKKHYADVRDDIKIVESDIIAFTETRLKQYQNTDSIENALSEFQIFFQNQSNDFLSLAICANACHGVAASGMRYFPEVNGYLVDLKKEKMRLKLFLLYWSRDMHPLLFCNRLENVMSGHEIQLILGYFNMNFFMKLSLDI